MSTDEEPRRKFAGFYKPYTTPVPDNFFDDVLPDLSGAEVKVLLYIFRRTFGWKKDSDNISLSQLVSGITRRDGTVLDRGTGLSKPSVSRTLQQLVAKGMLRKVRRQSAENGDEPTTYEPVLADETPVLKNATRGVSKLNPPVLQNPTHKKQSYKKSITVAKQDQPGGSEEGTDPGRQTEPEPLAKRDAAESSGSPLRRLPDLGLNAAHVELIAEDIVAQLRDVQSLKFYQLVARKVAEPFIRETLSAIKTDGARDPRRLFTYRMQQYALKRLYDIE
jgi:hypothetical protein